jgi:AMP deaminase
VITAEITRILASVSRCLDLRSKYLVSSLQRLGDNPRDHDGVFHGLPPSSAGVASVLPDADPTTFSQLPTHSAFEPWKVYPRPPEPHWQERASGDKVLKGHRAAPERETFEYKECEIPGKHEWAFKIDDRGVFQVYGSEQGMLTTRRQ